MAPVTCHSTDLKISLQVQKLVHIYILPIKDTIFHNYIMKSILKLAVGRLDAPFIQLFVYLQEL